MSRGMDPSPGRRLALVSLLTVATAPASAWAESDPEIDAVRLDAVRVTADPLGSRSVDDLTRPVTVLSGEELQRKQAGTIGEVLSGTPGVANSDFGPGVGRPVVRGQQGSRVLMLEDGLRTADVSGEGADHAVAVDSWRAEQIEVLRGPATLLYGGGAAGGVINMTTSRFRPEVPLDPSLAVSGRYSGNGDLRQGTLQGEVPVGDRVVVRADYGERRGGDFAIRGFQEVDQTEGFRGRLQNSSLHSDSAAVSAVITGEQGFVGLGLSRWNSDYGIPEVFDPQNLRGEGSDEFERVTAGYDRVDLRAERFTPTPWLQAVRVKAAYTRFDQEETEFEFSRSNGQLEDTEVEAAFLNREFEARVDAVQETWRGWDGVLGLSVNDRDFVADVPDSDDEAFYVRPNRTRSLALYTIQERELGRTRIEAGARVERERSRPEDVLDVAIEGVTLADGNFLPTPRTLDTRTSTPTAVSLGAVVDLGAGQRWRSAISRSQRTPSPEQLYAFGRHPAAGTFEVGDPDLDMERYVNVETGVGGSLGRLGYELSLFHTRAGAYVFLASEDDGSGSPVFVNDLGQRPGEGDTGDCAPGDGGPCRFRNAFVVNSQADARFSGAELAASYLLREGRVPTVLRASADRVQGRLAAGGSLPRITPARHGLGVDTGMGIGEGALRASLDWQRVSGQRRTAPGETPTAGFDLVSANLSWSSSWLGQDTTWFLQGRNLLNEEGRLHQSFFKDQAPIVGRAVVVGFRIELGG